MWYIIGFGLIILGLMMKNKADAQVITTIKTNWQELAQKWADYYKVPLSLVLAVIFKESGGNPLAIGGTGDWGLMQITQPALTDFNNKTGHSYNLMEMQDPDKCIEVGTWYLSWLYVQLGGWERALRAYNVGIGRVKQSETAGIWYAADVLAIQKKIEEVKV